MRKARTATHNEIAFFHTYWCILKSYIQPGETTTSYAVMHTCDLLLPAASCFASPAVIILASISGVDLPVDSHDI